MKEFWNAVQMVFTAISGWLGWFLGGCDGLLITLMAFMAVGYITSLMCTIEDKASFNRVSFKGVCCKVLIFILIGIGNILDVNIIGTGSVLRTAVILFYLSNEGGSILENAAYLDLPIPESLRDVLDQLHNKGRKKGK